MTILLRTTSIALVPQSTRASGAWRLARKRKPCSKTLRARTRPKSGVANDKGMSETRLAPVHPRLLGWLAGTLVGGCLVVRLAGWFVFDWLLHHHQVGQVLSEALVKKIAC